VAFFYGVLPPVNFNGNQSGQLLFDRQKYNFYICKNKFGGIKYPSYICIYYLTIKFLTMGYSTDFFGRWELNKPLTDEQANYINKFADTRRMKRNVKKLKELYKGEHGLNGSYGIQGEYFVGGTGFAGQDHDETIEEYNHPPRTQPSLWCQWNIVDNKYVEWDGSEKFYNYIEWIRYYIDNFFEPWGVLLNGEVQWQGEDREDIGKIIITDNEVKVVEGQIVFN
jgi:hypothetical protein